MRLSLNWLKDYCDVKLSTDELVHRLTMAGLEIEAVETVGKDTVLEIEITPNRPDCLNMLGLAREVGAITSKTVKFPKCIPPRSLAKKFPIAISDKNDCRRYVATLIQNVSVELTPAHIVERLQSMNVRSISNIVDITNFVLFETGQPTHAFDADKINGGKIFVRRAKAGEKLVTIDGIERKLDESILVIADSKEPIAIAGVMGGKATEVTSTTKNILLEVAHFDMGVVRRGGRKLGIKSDAAYRFERHVDPHGVPQANARALELILELAGGKIIAKGEVCFVKKSLAKPLKLTAQDIEKLLGANIPLKKAKDILTRLCFQVRSQGSNLLVKAPTYRNDVTIVEDLIEEVARVIGFDQLPTSMPTIPATNIALDQRPLEVKSTIRRTLLASGIDEAISYSMTSRKNMERCQLKNIPTIAVTNPLSIEQEILRPHLFPTLLPPVVLNLNRGNRDIRLFEIGNVFTPVGEYTALAILMTGRRHTDWRLAKKDGIEFSDIKGVLEQVARELKVTLTLKVQTTDGFDQGACAAIEYAGKVIGHVGLISKDVLGQWEIKGANIYALYLNIQPLLESKAMVVKYQPLNEFPGIIRDVSIAVKTDITFAAIEEIAKVNGGELLKHVSFVEQYIGDKIPAGQKGLVFSLLYQSSTRTLREDEVQAIHSRIVDQLKSTLQATQR